MAFWESEIPLFFALLAVLPQVRSFSHENYNLHCAAVRDLRSVQEVRRAFEQEPYRMQFSSAVGILTPGSDGPGIPFVEPSLLGNAPFSPSPLVRSRLINSLL